MKFTKMQGLGNDYIYVDCTREMISDIPERARKLSDRHFGVGSDGLVLICPSYTADFRMDMYNSDGSRAEMCGNAIRCVGKFVYERGLTDQTTVTIETLAGKKTLFLNVKGGKVKSVCVDMGEPIFTPTEIPVLTGQPLFFNQPVEVGGKMYSVSAVSMGNPHAVIFVDDPEEVNIEKLGPGFENHVFFPRKTNTEFVTVIDRKTVKMRVWERGAGETLACGTGACAVMAVCNALDYIDDEADIILRGGTLHVRLDKKTNKIYMEGAAEFVFDGETID